MKNLQKIFPAAFIFLLCILSLSSLPAQNGIGFRFGANFANQDWGDVVSENRTQTGLMGALIFELGLNPIFAIQPELGLYKKGTEATFDAAPDLAGLVEETSFTYLEIPVLLKLRLGDEFFQIYGLAGPSFGYALNGNRVIVDADGDEILDAEINFDEDNYSRLEMGIHLGAGVEVGFGPGVIILDGRYLYGLSSSSDVELFESETTTTVRNKGVNVSVGYIFKFGGA